MNNYFVRLGRSSINTNPNFYLVFSLILSVVLGGCSFKISHGADTPDQVVEQYLLALENKDESLMLQLIPRNYLADQAIKDKISQFGGHDIQDHKVAFSGPKPVILRTTVHATYTSKEGGNKKFEDIFFIEYQGNGFLQRTLQRQKGRWYLLLGKSKIPDQS